MGSEMVKEIGNKAENHFMSLLNAKGIPYSYVDDWYDFEVCDEKVELKSCAISVKQGDRYRSGRFDFTKEKNREMQYKANVWVAFMARAAGLYILLGFCRAKQLHQHRYITLSQYRDLKLIDFDEWVRRVNK